MTRFAARFGSYLSLIKFSHTVFALPFAMIGLTTGIRYRLSHDAGWNWPAEGLLLLLQVVGCMIFARSAAMAFNRWLDRRFDALNPRTAQREIPAGVITPKNALVFTIVNCVLFLAVTATINLLCLALAPVALFVILFYSYTKRFTPLCHLVLGLGLSLAPIGAFLAVTGVFSLLPLLFSFAVLTWVSGFDIIYALQDEQFDRANQLHSIPEALGAKNALHLSEALHLVSAGMLLWAGVLAQGGFVYWTGYAVFTGLLFYQHTLVKPGALSRVNMAFANTNGLASLLFALFTITSFAFGI